MLKKIGEVFRNLSSFFRHPYQCSDMKIRLDAALKNSFEPELSYILAELFNICLKESCFPDCGKFSSMRSHACTEECWGKVYCEKLLPC